MMNFLVSILAVFRVIVLPVQFQDCKMTASTTEFTSMLKDASAYMTEQLGYEVCFELGPLSTLPNPTSYYGRNSGDIHDVNIGEAVSGACRSVQSKVDFSRYDNDGDGVVDCVALITAGLSEADGTSEDNIWPQQNSFSNLTTSFYIGNAAIKKYVVSCELWSKAGNNRHFCGIGTLCHEFCHILGLVDYYDTDGVAGGGKSTAMYATTALMDEGNRNNEGRTPPYFNALDCHLLGLGECSELAEGEYTLPPMDGKNRKYLKYETGNEGEFYLFEARSNTGRDAYIGGNGLLVYHIDRSAPYIDRWESNRVNCDPAHQCAFVVPANPKAASASEAFYPYGDTRDFTSLPLALLDIARKDGGNVSFKVIRPFKSINTDVYQDAAIISWLPDEYILGKPYTATYKAEGQQAKTISIGTISNFTLENLTPNTKYEVEVKVDCNNSRVFSFKTEFTTKVKLDDTLPFIILSTAERNSDGTFVYGSRIPLRICNLENVREVTWYFDDLAISTFGSGYYSLFSSGTLKAYVIHKDGSVTILSKTIIVK